MKLNSYTLSFVRDFLRSSNSYSGYTFEINVQLAFERRYGKRQIIVVCDKCCVLKNSKMRVQIRELRVQIHEVRAQNKLHNQVQKNILTN